MLRRRKLPTELEPTVQALRTVVDHIEAAKDVMTSTVPTTRMPGTPLPDALLELDEHLGQAKELMNAWRHPEVENEWRACDDAIDESLRRSRKLREDGPDLGGFEGLIWAVDQVLAPLEAFEAAAERFRKLRR